jgi:glycosyltransferase involved in cell wall biosynthesis
MRVTMLVRCLAMMRGGGETRHLAWARELIALGVDVDFIVGRPLMVGLAKYPIAGVRTTVIRSPYMRDLVYRVGRRRGFGRLMMMALHGDEEWFCRAAWSRIAARPVQPDIVHAHALHQTARLRRGNIPVVINLPGPPHPRYAHDLSLADAIVADGWAAANLPASLGRRVEPVPKGVDALLFRPDGVDKRADLGLEGKRVIIAVSRLVPIKNIRLLIDALPAVLAAQPDAHLLIVGEGPERRALWRRAREQRLTGAITFAGYVPQAETPAYYRTANVFALSSEFDNSPNALLEAMACGLRVVATDVGGVREHVDAVRGSELVPAGDVVGFAAALVRALANLEAARRDGEHNRKFAAERFSWRASALRLLEIYRDVLAARSQPLASATVSA